MKKILLILLVAIVSTAVVKDVTLKFPSPKSTDKTETDTTKGSLIDYLDHLPDSLGQVYERIKHKWDDIRKNIIDRVKNIAIETCKGILVQRDKECTDLINGIATYFE